MKYILTKYLPSSLWPMFVRRFLRQFKNYTRYRLNLFRILELEKSFPISTEIIYINYIYIIEIIYILKQDSSPFFKVFSD